MRFAGTKSVLRNGAWLLGSHSVSMAARALYVLILARALGAESYGVLNYALSWYLVFIGLTHLGLDVVLSREIGRTREGSAALAGASLALRGAAILIVWLLSIGAALVLESDPTARTLLLVLSFALAARAAWLWCGSIFTAFEATGAIMALDLLFRPLEVILLVLLLTFGEVDLVAIAAIHAACWCCQAAAGIFLVTRRVTPLHFAGLRRRAAGLLVQGLPGAVYAVAAAWFLQAPVVLYRQLLGIGEGLGHFALAFQIMGYVQAIPYIVATAALPVLSRSAARGDGRDRTAALALLLLVPAAGAVLGLGGLWLSQPFVTLVFGSGYSTAAPILAEGLWLLIPLGLAVFLQQFAFSAGLSPLRTSAPPIAGMAAMAALFQPLAGTHGYSGAMLATAVGLSIWAGGLLLALYSSGFFGSRAAKAV